MTDDLRTRALLSLNPDCLHSPGEFRAIVGELLREVDAAVALLFRAQTVVESRHRNMHAYGECSNPFCKMGDLESDIAAAIRARASTPPVQEKPT